MLPLPLTKACLADIHLVASDVDGTLTQNVKFTPALLEAIGDLTAVGINVLLVTGRSAGWVSALVNYLPVTGAIAENGGLFFNSAGNLHFLSAIALTHRQQLEAAFIQLQKQFPSIRESTDNSFRLTDWTFDVEGLSDRDLEAIALQCQASGWGFTYSTVQCHIKPLAQDKATGLRQVLNRYYPDLRPEQVLTVGDSPNDEVMFDQQQFPVSVGVGNVLHYAERMKNLPRYVTELQEVEGFCELVRLLLDGK
jgi:HAD superfamily hydrolase (TIGR01484 family)